MTARARKKSPWPNTPPVACQIAGCGEEYDPVGTYKETHRAAELGGWLYRIIGHNGRRYVGDWLCPGHKHQLPWWPGVPRLALPARVAGSTRAEFLGVVPQAALPPPDVSRPGSEDNLAYAQAGPGHTEDPLAEYQAASNELQYALQAADDLEPLPPLPQRTPEGPPEPFPPSVPGWIHEQDGTVCPTHLAPAHHERLWCTVHQQFVRAPDVDEEPRPGGTIYPELTEEALAGGVPLESLAPEQEDEAQT